MHVLFSTIAKSSHRGSPRRPMRMNVGEMVRVLRDLPMRSQAFTPLSRQGEPIGVIDRLHASEVRPFNAERDRPDDELRRPGRHRHREYAAPVNELRQRTDDLTESLEQQTATSEVLRVISSSSPGELEPVFQAMLDERYAHLRCQIRPCCSGMRTARFAHHRDARRPGRLMENSCRRGPIRSEPPMHRSRAMIRQQSAFTSTILDSRDSNSTRIAIRSAWPEWNFGGIRTLLVCPDAQGR